jgi:serine/threonine-protein kinase
MVAVKILKPELTRDADTVARFSREATAMSLLTHANTTRVYDFGQTDDGLLYLVMEYLEGQLITQRVAERGFLPVMEALRTGQQILRSLNEAHTKGIIHRDLKPDNIFVARAEGHHTDMVKVLDFGIAKVVAPDRRMDQFETQAGTVFGTPRYMSPEQAQGAALDQRSDLYSVGALLYQMLTGRAPFTDDDAVVVMARHIQEMPEPPRSVVPQRPIPASLEAVVMRALAKAPDERFQTAATFEAALEECVVDVLAAESASGHPLARRRSRRNLLWALSAFSLMFASYAGLRVLAKVGEPPVAAGAIAPSPPEQEAAQVVALRAVSAAPDDAVPAQPEAAPPESAEPAVVAIRSKPPGAMVIRDGRKLGETPISLLVQPSEPFVRVELRLAGYQPLAAELTAKDGERMLKLTKEAKEAAPPPKLSRKPRVVRKSAPPPAREPAHAPAPASKPSSDPYERFE